jgi:hypothetical protein
LSPPLSPSLASSLSDRRRRERGPKSKVRCADYFINGYQGRPGCMTNRAKGNKKERCPHKPPAGAEGVPDAAPALPAPPLLGKRKVRLDRALHAA